jgi:hypothetical protein
MLLTSQSKPHQFPEKVRLRDRRVPIAQIARRVLDEKAPPQRRLRLGGSRGWSMFSLSLICVISPYDFSCADELIERAADNTRR